MGDHHDVLQDLREPTRSLRKAILDAWSGFVAFPTGAMADGEAWEAFLEFHDEQATNATGGQQ